MDRAGQAVARGWIVNGIIAKRHVADNCVKIVVRKLCFFKTLAEYRGVGVELLGDPGGERVKFHTCPMAALQSLRHTAEEMPDPHRRLKHLDAVPYAEFFQSMPDCLNNKRGGKMRVWRCCPR